MWSFEDSEELRKDKERFKTVIDPFLTKAMEDKLSPYEIAVVSACLLHMAKKVDKEVSSKAFKTMTMFLTEHSSD